MRVCSWSPPTFSPGFSADQRICGLTVNPNLVTGREQEALFIISAGDAFVIPAGAPFTWFTAPSDDLCSADALPQCSKRTWRSYLRLSSLGRCGLIRSLCLSHC